MKSLICCTYFLSRNTLRKTPKGRTILNYKLGIEHIDKDLDIGNIIKALRRLNYFMKMILDVDQRKLLKLRSGKFINSDQEFSIFSHKKVLKKDKML